MKHKLRSRKSVSKMASAHQQAITRLLVTIKYRLAHSEKFLDCFGLGACGNKIYSNIIEFREKNSAE